MRESSEVCTEMSEKCLRDLQNLYKELLLKAFLCKTGTGSFFKYSNINIKKATRNTKNQENMILLEK